jgi:hypothetical protein
VVASYETLHDYAALYEKEERAIANGELQTIRLTFRKPFDVRLEWLARDSRVDQVVVYRRGFNRGRLIVRRSGILGSLAGVISLDPHASLAMSDSRHPITEIGIGSLIDRVAAAHASRAVSHLPPEPDTLDARPTWRFEFTAVGTASPFGVDGARRAVLWVDDSWKLPVKVEIFDGAGTLLERHRFKDLRVDIGVADATFTL